MTKELIRPLTSLRFYAAFLVFLVHVPMVPGLEWMAVDHLQLQGKIGVSIFFVLSGFIMCHVYYGNDRWPGTRAAGWRFHIARITRLYPLHLLTLVLALPLALHSNTARIDPANLPYHITLVNLFSPVHAFGHQPNKVAWTLSCEMFFYLSTPLLFLLMLRTGARMWQWLSALFLLLVAATYALAHVPGVYVATAPFRWADYILGILAFLHFRAHRDAPGRRGWMLPVGIAWFAALSAVNPSMDPALPITPLLLPGSLLVVLGTAYIHDTRSWWLASDRMVLLGEASFALYMVHELCLRYLRVVMTKTGLEVPIWLGPVAIIAVFAGIQLVALLAHKRFEMPLQQHGRTWLNRLFGLDKDHSKGPAVQTLS